MHKHRTGLPGHAPNRDANGAEGYDYKTWRFLAILSDPTEFPAVP